MGLETSAEMKWKRCVEGFFAAAYGATGMVSPLVPTQIWGCLRREHTLISPTTCSSLTAFRDTMMTLAPFSASCRAALRPMPSEAPVTRTVCEKSTH